MLDGQNLETIPVQEDIYLVHADDSGNRSKKRRRGKSVLPASLEDLDLNSAFFSSTQAINTDNDVAALKPQRRKPVRMARVMDSCGGSRGSPKPCARSTRARGGHASFAREHRSSAPRSASEGPAADLSQEPPPEKRFTRSMADPSAQAAEALAGSALPGPASNGAAKSWREAGAPAQRGLEPSGDLACSAEEGGAAMAWGCTSPRNRACRPASRVGLPEHLHAEGGNDGATRATSCFARLPEQGSAAERARARAMGTAPDVMFDRLLTRAGMQMPIVRTVPFDAHASPTPGMPSQVDCPGIVRLLGYDMDWLWRTAYHRRTAYHSRQLGKIMATDV